MSCLVCEVEESKYKCPVCREPYCSVACCKLHKENKCEPAPVFLEDKVKNSTLSSYKYPTEDTVPIEKLKLLEHSDDLKNCLRNPHLRKILKALDSNDAPAHLMKEFMQEPIFTEFVDQCLNVVSPEEKKNNTDKF